MKININTKQYTRFELNISFNSSLLEFNQWNMILVEFMKHFLPEDKVVCLLTLDDRSTSVIHEFNQPVKKVIRNGLKYQYITVNNLNEKMLNLLVDESEFYLGYLIIGLVDINGEEDFINMLINLKFGKKDISIYNFETQCILMEGDGTLFYWMNPKFSKSECEKYIMKLQDGNI